MVTFTEKLRLEIKDLLFTSVSELAENHSIIQRSSTNLTRYQILMYTLSNSTGHASICVSMRSLTGHFFNITHRA